MSPRIVAFGAGGFLGLSTVAALQAAGLTPTCGRRKRSNVLGLRQLKVPLVVADLDAPDTVRAAVEGAEVVVQLAGHYPKLSLDRDGAIRTARTQMTTLLDACADAQVRRLVYVSSTATVAPRPQGWSDETDRFAASPGYGTYHEVKWQLESLSERERRFEVVTVCPGACIGPHDYRLGTAAFLAATARRMQPVHPDGWVNVVDVRDVGTAIARLVTHPQPPRRLVLSAEPWKLQSLLELIAPRYGAPPPLPALPADQAVMLADREERRVQKEGGRPTLSRELVDLVVHGVPVDAALSRTALGLHYRPLSETLGAFDAWALKIGLLSSSSTPLVPPPHPVATETTA